MTPDLRIYYAPTGEWLVTSDNRDGRVVANYGKGEKAAAKAERHVRMDTSRRERLAAALHASLAATPTARYPLIGDELTAALAERRDTIEAYRYLAEWEAGAHCGDHDEPALRLRTSHRVCQTA